ncbi:TPA: type II toxin-antitoxin system HicA family toxin [Legionella pneumophila]|nr:type II toxin-antitoxin system HicA family toxin [Legionella pneumophila]
MINRRQFIKHVEQHGCSLLRHGNKHDIYKNDVNPNLISGIPRHTQINPYTAKGICKDLGIPQF